MPGFLGPCPLPLDITFIPVLARYQSLLWSLFKGSKTIMQVGMETRRDEMRQDRLCKDTEGSKMMQKLENKQ